MLDDVVREQESRCATDAEMEGILSDVARHSSLGPRYDSEPESQRSKKKSTKAWKKKAKQATVFSAPSKEAWGDAPSLHVDLSSPENKEPEAREEKGKKRRKKKKGQVEGGDKDAGGMERAALVYTTKQTDRHRQTQRQTHIHPRIHTYIHTCYIV